MISYMWLRSFMFIMCVESYVDCLLVCTFPVLNAFFAMQVPASRADTPSAALVRPRSTVAIVQSRGGLSDRSARHQLDENKNSNMKHLPWSERSELVYIHIVAVR